MLWSRHAPHAICLLLLVLSGVSHAQEVNNSANNDGSSKDHLNEANKSTGTTNITAQDNAPSKDNLAVGNQGANESTAGSEPLAGGQGNESTQTVVSTTQPNTKDINELEPPTELDPNQTKSDSNSGPGAKKTQVAPSPDPVPIKKIEGPDFTKIANDKGEISLLDAVSMKILVGESDAISLASLSLIRQPELMNSTALNVYSVDFHWDKMFVFYAANNTIYRARLAGRAALEDHTVLVNKGADGPVQLAVDWVHDKIYWISTTYRTVEVMDLDGKNRKMIFDAIGEFSYPNNIAVDPYANTLFIVSHYTVFRCDLSKQDIFPQLLKPVGNIPGDKDQGVRALALDRRNQHIYITGVKMNDDKSKSYTMYLTRTAYDGKDVVSGDDVYLPFDEFELKKWNDIYSMDVFMDTLYFAHYVQDSTTPDTLHKVLLKDKKFNATKLYVPKYLKDSIWSIRVLHPCVQRPSDHPTCQRK